MELIKNLCVNEANGKNLVFSPLSIYAALGLLTNGSAGRTLEQLLAVLNYESLSHLNSTASQIIDSLDQTKIGTGHGGPKLSFIGGAWMQSSCTLKALFKQTANSIYKADAAAVDFQTKAKEVREAVNKWVEDNTDGLIKNFLPEGSIDEVTRFVLANVLYFKGSWEENQFDRSQTKNSEFYLLDGRCFQVPFMTSDRLKQSVCCYDGFKVLQLPYRQAPNNIIERIPKGRFSMYIILPDRLDGLGSLIEMVSSDAAGFLGCYVPKYQERVPVREFKVPKFKIAFGFEAKRVLQDLGLVLPFDRNEAELTEMMSGDGRLSVSKVFHSCFVEVDEVGTEAAASTAVIGAAYGCSAAPPPPPTVDFVADHPFMLLIRDNQSGVVLFMGYVLNPLLN